MSYPTKLVPLVPRLKNIMKTFECFLGVNISCEDFAITEQFATALQCKHMISSASTANAMTVVATDQASNLQLLRAVSPRKCRPPRRIDEGDLPYVYPDCATYDRINTWYAIIDTVTDEINERFSQECTSQLSTLRTCCCEQPR
jgi:hypothetical protein